MEIAGRGRGVWMADAQLAPQSAKILDTAMVPARLKAIARCLAIPSVGRREVATAVGIFAITVFLQRRL